MNDNAARAETYRNRAEEVRIIAESMKDNDAKQILLTVAADYLKMAARLEHMHTVTSDPDKP